MVKRMNRKGLVEQIYIVLIMAFVLALIILMFWVGSMTLPILFGAGSMVTDQLSNSINTQSPNSDLSNATNTAISMTRGILGIGETLTYIAMLILIVGFIMLAFYVRSYPFLAFFWIFIIIALTFMAMLVSNSYTQASQSPATEQFYQQWGQNDFLMSNLPIIVVVIGVFGGIFLFVLASREPESEVQIL